jgi:N utilization substance protein B
MSARSKARKRALDLIFAAEARGRAPGEFLDDQLLSGERPTNDYTVELVRGVAERLERIDELISTYAEGWSLERMPAVDRNVLRLGVFEVLWVDDVPDAVAVSEALNLVRELSTDESPTFVNGVLGHIVRDKERLTAEQ